MPYLPRFVYEVLPYVYIVLGVLAMFNVEWLTGRVSGLLLMAAGVAIWHLRRMYRAEVKRRSSAWRTKW